MSVGEDTWEPFDEIAANDPAPLDCTNCQHLTGPVDVYCERCGYPVRGGETEQQRFTWRQESLEIDTNLAEKRVRQGRNMLFITAAISVGSGMLLSKQGNVYLISGIILGIIYAILGAWANQKAFAALLTGLVLYLSLQGFEAVTNPAVITKGLLIKVIIVVFLAKGLSGARELLNLQRAKTIE